jgi:hypothetical protein
MTARLIRAENLLWAVPILFGLLANYAAYSDVALVYLDDNYYILTFPTLIGISLLVMLIPFMMHSVLRDLGQRSFFASWAHVFFSCLLIATILFIYTYALPINIKWRYYMGELPAYKKWSYYNTLALGIFQLLVYIQAAYLIYGVSVLVKHRVDQKRLEREHYDYIIDHLDPNNSGSLSKNAVA